MNAAKKDPTEASSCLAMNVNLLLLLFEPDSSSVLTCSAGVQDSERRANRLPPSIILAVSMLARVVTWFECDGDFRYNKDPEWVAFNTLVETTKECEISFDKTRLIIYKLKRPQIHA